MTEYLPFDCDECDLEFDASDLTLFDDRILCNKCLEEVDP